MNCQFCKNIICNTQPSRINNYKCNSSNKLNCFEYYLKCIFDFKEVNPFHNNNPHCFTVENCSGFVDKSIQNFIGKSLEYYLLKSGLKFKRDGWSILTIEAIRKTYYVRPIFDLTRLPFSILFVRKQNSTDSLPNQYSHVMFHIRDGIVAGRNHPGNLHGIYHINQLYNYYKDGRRPIGETNDYVFQFEYITVDEVFRSLG